MELKEKIAKSIFAYEMKKLGYACYADIQESVTSAILPIIEAEVKAERAKVLLEAERLFEVGIDNFYISRRDWQALREEASKP